MLKQMHMSDYENTHTPTNNSGRNRRWSAEAKLRIVEDSFASDSSISSVARQNGVPPSLLYRWRKLMSEGGAVSVSKDEDVVALSEVKRLEKQVRELERMLGKKTMEAEILREALDKTGQKKRNWRPPLLPKGNGQ